MVNSIISLVATTDGYSGSEFCSGLLFGIHGSNMLLNIAKTFTQKIEQIIEDIDKFNRQTTTDKKYIAAESK